MDMGVACHDGCMMSCAPSWHYPTDPSAQLLPIADERLFSYWADGRRVGTACLLETLAAVDPGCTSDGSCLPKELLLDLPDHRLEHNHVHRVLQPLHPDGPRGTYWTNLITTGSRKNVCLSPRNQPRCLSENIKSKFLRTYPFSLFSSAGPWSRFSRHCPHKELKYRWTFLLRLHFTYNKKPYSFTSFTEGEDLPVQLGHSRNAQIRILLLPIRNLRSLRSGINHHPTSCSDLIIPPVTFCFEF